MNYPSDFPDHLKGPVDTAFTEAEIEFSRAQKQVRSQGGPTKQDTIRDIKKYAKHVFLAFAHAACKAVEQGAWKAERCRSQFEHYRKDLTNYLYFNKVWWRSDSSEAYDIDRDIKREFEDTEEWTKIQDELKKAIESSSTARRFNAGMPKRGYRSEIQAWMGEHGISSVKAAARRLAVSESVLKSIMTTKGRIRHSSETLDKVLKAIGYSTGHQNGDQS